MQSASSLRALFNGGALSCLWWVMVIALDAYLVVAGSASQHACSLAARWNCVKVGDSTVLDKSAIPIESAVLADMNANKLVINNLVSLRRVFGHARSLPCDGNNPESSLRRSSCAFIFHLRNLPCRLLCSDGISRRRNGLSAGHAFDTRFLSAPVSPAFFLRIHDTRHCLGWCRNPVNFSA